MEAQSAVGEDSILVAIIELVEAAAAAPVTLATKSEDNTADVSQEVHTNYVYQGKDSAAQ